MLADADLVITGEGKFECDVAGVQDLEARSDGLTVLSLTELYGSSRALSDTVLAITDAVAGNLATLTQRGH